MYIKYYWNVSEGRKWWFSTHRWMEPVHRLCGWIKRCYVIAGQQPVPVATTTRHTHFLYCSYVRNNLIFSVHIFVLYFKWYLIYFSIISEGILVGNGIPFRCFHGVSALSHTERWIRATVAVTRLVGLTIERFYFLVLCVEKLTEYRWPECKAFFPRFLFTLNVVWYMYSGLLMYC